MRNRKPSFWGALEEVALGVTLIGAAVGVLVLHFRYGVVMFQEHSSRPAAIWSIAAGSIFMSIVGLLFVVHGSLALGAARRSNGS